ncbi:isoamyl acetate-hydrolyzing esterase [Irineochytrium annulatum]|nr:isoamyl acetate-hydrolyzing esterase [Irineochytrium annulatum]
MSCWLYSNKYARWPAAHHSIAIIKHPRTSQGLAYCWGSNYYSQAGHIVDAQGASFSLFTSEEEDMDVVEIPSAVPILTGPLSSYTGATSTNLPVVEEKETARREKEESETKDVNGKEAKVKEAGEGATKNSLRQEGFGSEEPGKEVPKPDGADILTTKEGLRPDGADIVDVACGDFHTMVLTSTGVAWSWGAALQGDGTERYDSQPTPISFFQQVGRRVLSVKASGCISLVTAEPETTSAPGSTPPEVYIWGYLSRCVSGTRTYIKATTPLILIDALRFTGGVSMVEASMDAAIVVGSESGADGKASAAIKVYGMRRDNAIRSTPGYPFYKEMDDVKGAYEEAPSYTVHCDHAGIEAKEVKTVFLLNANGDLYWFKETGEVSKTSFMKEPVATVRHGPMGAMIITKSGAAYFYSMRDLEAAIMRDEEVGEHLIVTIEMAPSHASIYQSLLRSSTFFIALMTVSFYLSPHERLFDNMKGFRKGFVNSPSIKPSSSGNRELLKVSMPSLALDQFVLFGDSITQWGFNPDISGWGVHLAHAYIRKIDIINRGYSGFNTEWCREILPEVLRTTLPHSPSSKTPPKILLMTLFLGANDAVLPDANPRQPVTIPRYKENIKAMLATLAKEAPGAKAVLITPPPVDPSRWGVQCKDKGRPVDRTVERTMSYRDAALAVASEVRGEWGANLVVVDTWEVFLGKGKVNALYEMEAVKDLLSDGLHLTAKGNKLLAKALLESIGSHWPELAPSSMKPKVIWHDEVDKSDLSSLFRNA